ncbi:jg13281 [Pararge aegeria aegeria]|uniref:Jg13281 protein n=1 Tax=Pararge aegeria aegeria TaxID=348720 RepID=A0A8S4RES2_9NEOP|nr:jg13281 [Pararge aegeria aegeria]
MERSMLGFTRKDGKRCKDLREITKLEDAVTLTKTLKWRWTGHMLREKREKWTKAMTEWEVRDGSKRNKGRQRKRWVDDIKQTAGILWSRKARNRHTWKHLEKAYASEDALITVN